MALGEIFISQQKGPEIINYKLQIALKVKKNIETSPVCFFLSKESLNTVLQDSVMF